MPQTDDYRMVVLSKRAERLIFVLPMKRCIRVGLWSTGPAGSGTSARAGVDSLDG